MRSSPNLSVDMLPDASWQQRLTFTKTVLWRPEAGRQPGVPGPKRLLLTTAMCNGMARQEQTPERCRAVVSP